MTGASNDLHSARTRSQAALRRVSTSTTHTNSSLTNVFQDTLRPHPARCRKWKPCCNKFSAASYVNDRKTSSIHSYFFVIQDYLVKHKWTPNYNSSSLFFYYHFHSVSSLTLVFAGRSQTAGLVIQPCNTVTKDVFVWAVASRTTEQREAPCKCALEILLLTYLFTAYMHF